MTLERHRLRQERRPVAALDAAGLDRLALGYVGRYATTRAKLADYLNRKLIERGWQGEGEPPVAAVVTRLADAKYVDDRGFADARGAALVRRGLGAGRVAIALRAAGISAEDGEQALDAAREEGWGAALAFARRRRIGPYAVERAEGAAVQRAMGALLRAGHAPVRARAIVKADPGTIPEDPAG